MNYVIIQLLSSRKLSKLWHEFSILLCCRSKQIHGYGFRIVESVTFPSSLFEMIYPCLFCLIFLSKLPNLPKLYNHAKRLNFNVVNVNFYIPCISALFLILGVKMKLSSNIRQIRQTNKTSLRNKPGNTKELTLTCSMIPLESLFCGS